MQLFSTNGFNFQSTMVLPSDTWYRPSTLKWERWNRDRIRKKNRENERGVEEASKPVTAHQFLRRCIDRLSRLDIREVIHFLDRRRRGARAAPFVTQAEEIIDTATLSGGPLRTTEVWWGGTLRQRDRRTLVFFISTWIHTQNGSSCTFYIEFS